MVMRKSVSIYSGGKPYPLPEGKKDHGFGGVDLQAFGTEVQDLGNGYRGTMVLDVSPEGLLTITYGRGYALEGERYGYPIQLPLPMTQKEARAKGEQ